MLFMFLSYFVIIFIANSDQCDPCGLNQIYTCGRPLDCTETCNTSKIFPPICQDPNMPCEDNCYCKENYLFNEGTGECVRSDQCLYLSCADPNAYYKPSNACINKCLNAQGCTKEVYYGCFCEEPFCADECGNCVVRTTIALPTTTPTTTTYTRTTTSTTATPLSLSTSTSTTPTSTLAISTTEPSTTTSTTTECTNTTTPTRTTRRHVTRDDNDDSGEKDDNKDHDKDGDKDNSGEENRNKHHDKGDDKDDDNPGEN